MRIIQKNEAKSEKSAFFLSSFFYYFFYCFLSSFLGALPKKSNAAKGSVFNFVETSDLVGNVVTGENTSVFETVGFVSGFLTSFIL